MNKHITNPTLLLLTMLLMCSVALAQHPLDPNTGGTRYIIAIPDTTTNRYYANTIHQRFEDGIALMMYSPVDTKVLITRTNDTTKEYQLQAGKFKTVELMGSDGFRTPIVTTPNQPVDNTFQITSEAPIVVYCYMLTGFGCEAWTPLPVEAWGKQYYAAAHSSEVGSDIPDGGTINFNRTNTGFPSAILVVAAFDNTQVSIQPNGSLQDYPAITMTLRAGQVYMVQSNVDTLTAHIGNPDYQCDLGGSIIYSSEPIGVISGNTRAQVYGEIPGLSGNAFRNMLIEWITPTNLHGREFVYMPSWDSRKPTGAPKEDLNGKRLSEFVRIYSTDPDSTPGTPTSVKIRNGQDTVPIDATTTVHPSGLAGWLYQDRVTNFYAHHYRTAGRAQVFMASPGVSRNLGLSGGGSFKGAQYRAWGGFMTELVPRERWASFAPYFAPTAPDSMEHFINVVTEYNHRNDVYTEDGSPFVFNQGTIPGTDLCWGTMSVMPGYDHYLEGRNGARFYAVVYGQFAGDELFIPGSTQKKDGGSELAMRWSNAVELPMTLATYEERQGLGYAYPLVSWNSIPSTSGVDQHNVIAPLQLQLTPNPAGAITTVRYILTRQSTIVISVTDILGQQVLIQHLGTTSPGVQSEIIQTESLAPGMYNVTVRDEEGVVYGVGKLGVRGR